MDVLYHPAFAAPDSFAELVHLRNPAAAPPDPEYRAYLIVGLLEGSVQAACKPVQLDFPDYAGWH